MQHYEKILQLFYTTVYIEKSRGKSDSNRHPPDGSKGMYWDMVSNEYRYDSNNLKTRCRLTQHRWLAIHPARDKE